jgi:hypothetical protein
MAYQANKEPRLELGKMIMLAGRQKRGLDKSQ